MRVPGPIVDLGTKKTYIFEFCVFFTFSYFFLYSFTLVSLLYLFYLYFLFAFYHHFCHLSWPIIFSNCHYNFLFSTFIFIFPPPSIVVLLDFSLLLLPLAPSFRPSVLPSSAPSTPRQQPAAAAPAKDSSPY